MATTQGLFYDSNIRSARVQGVQFRTSAEIDTDNIGADLTGLNDVRNIIKTENAIRVFSVVLWTKLMDTNAVPLLQLKVEATDGTTTKTFIPATLVAASGVENLFESALEPLFETLDNTDGTVWDWNVTATVAAATAGTVGEMVLHIEYGATE